MQCDRWLRVAAFRWREPRDEAVFADASAGGEDVFFVTEGRLGTRRRRQLAMTCMTPTYAARQRCWCVAACAGVSAAVYDQRLLQAGALAATDGLRFAAQRDVLRVGQPRAVLHRERKHAEAGRQEEDIARQAQTQTQAETQTRARAQGRGCASA